MMYNDDLDALAAEYVLGTLAPDERSHAETMIAVDPGFIEIVRQWERRLGELNVMVEAVEPPAEIWNKIKSGIGTVAQSRAADFASRPLPPIAVSAKPETEAEADFKFEDGVFASLGGPAANVSLPEAEVPHESESEQVETEQVSEQVEAGSESEPESELELEPESESEAITPTPADLLLSPSPPAPPQTERSADVIDLSRRVRRWRGLAVGCGALAAALAALVVVSQVKPGLIPGGFHVPQLAAQSPSPSSSPAAPQGGRLIAVLQQDPSAPAFLLTVEPGSRTMTVRTVAAKAEASHSFELWLVGPRGARPLSLGLIGSAEYTELPLPADFDAAAMRAATYAVSFEPAGGSKTGVPTGPILFTGKLVESLPPPSASKT